MRFVDYDVYLGCLEFVLFFMCSDHEGDIWRDLKAITDHMKSINIGSGNQKTLYCGLWVAVFLRLVFLEES
jgi:hypothetical protein